MRAKHLLLDISYYCLCDTSNLKSVHVVANGSGAVKQVNEYYPYGVSWGDASTYQGFQKFKYNGKELDRMHGLFWYDYGARRYDPTVGMFTQVDPLCEQYPHLNPYLYCAGNPVRYVDPDGRDYWSTNDLEQIQAFLHAIQNGDDVFDFTYWTHATDASIVGNLTYNDVSHRYYTSYTRNVNGELNVIGLSFDANLKPVSFSGLGYSGAFVCQPATGFWQKLLHYLQGKTYYDGFFNWNVDVNGRIIGIAPLTGTPPLVMPAGKAAQYLMKATKFLKREKMGRAIGNMSGNRSVQKEQIDALCSKYGIKGAKRQELHRMVGHQGLGYNEIEELILELLR